MVDLRAAVVVLGGSGLQARRVHNEMGKRWQAPGTPAAELQTYTLGGTGRNTDGHPPSRGLHPWGRNGKLNETEGIR